jgi:hypothetical protein
MFPVAFLDMEIERLRGLLALAGETLFFRLTVTDDFLQEPALRFRHT